MQGLSPILFSSTLVLPSIVSHSDILSTLKSIGVGGSVLSICNEFLSNCRLQVVVDGAASEWIPIVSGMPQGSVLGPLCLSFILVKCLSWWRSDYMLLLMIPHY